MKTLILFVIVLIFIAASSDGCQDNKDKKENKATSLYLKKVYGDNWHYTGWQSGYCRYKLFEDMHRRTVIDTICIYCPVQDSISLGCIKETDYRFIWDQEYHREDSIMTWKPMYIEKLNTGTECIECPESKQKYVITTYGYIW